MGPKPNLRLESALLAIAAGALAGILLCASPLLGIHGAESALVLGLSLPPFVAAAAAGQAAAIRRRSLGVSAAGRIRQGLGVTAWIVAIPIGLLAINGLRVPNCTPLLGLAFMLLGPVAGAFVASIVGTFLGSLGSNRGNRFATAIAAFVPVASIAMGVHGFWASPGVAAFGHFVGYFPGTIYDENVGIPTAFLTFRATSLLLCIGLSLLLIATDARAVGAVRLSRIGKRPLAAAMALLCLGLVMLAEVRGPELGHRSTSEHMAEALGATARGERCTVHAPRELDRKELWRLVRDCDFRVAQIEEVLGVEQREPVVAFFFRDPEEKQRLMGAGRTYIAKPWRREVYLHLRGFPHPVLAHELAHVIAGNMAVGPFRVGGQFGGWLPDPVLIEGVAVAVTWGDSDQLTPHQWARAMRDLDMMPPLDEVVGLSFLGQPARNAYTIAGSFLRFVLDRYGPGAVRSAYRGGSFEQATGKSLSELEAEWHEHLDQVALPTSALALARVRFSQSSIFSAVCPHRVAALKEQLAGDLSAGDDRGAARTCGELLDIDPHDDLTRADLVGALVRRGQDELADRELRTLGEEPVAPATIVARAREAMADAHWQAGDRNGAAAIYRELLDAPQSEDTLRTIEVKALAVVAGGEEGELLRDLLLGPDLHGSTAQAAVHLAWRLDGLRSDGLGRYLAARQLVFARRYDLARPLLAEARRRGLPTSRLDEEALRLEGASLFAIGWYRGARQRFEELRSRPDLSNANGAQTEDWLARIRYAQSMGSR